MALTFGPKLGLLVGAAQGEAHYLDLMKQWRGFDALIQSNVLSATTTAQPGSPSDGDTYILPESGLSGASWPGNEGKVARYSGVAAAWEYYTPKRGWRAWSQANDGLYYHTGSAWALQFAARIDASGSNVAAGDLTIDASLSTGNATPAARIWRVGVQGASGSTPQTATEVLRLVEMATASSRAVMAWNPNGPVNANIPLDIASALLADGIAGTFGTQFRLIRAASNPSFIGVRVNTSYQAPSGTLSGQTVFGFEGRGYSSGSAGVVQLASVVFVTKENTTDTNRGAAVRLLAVPLGGATAQATLIEFRSPSSGTTDIEMLQATTRFIGGATLTGWRNSGNSAYLDQWTDAGVRRIIGPIALGTVGADPDGCALLDMVSTTRGLLIPRMTTTQRDAITAVNGLLIYNTTAGKFQGYEAGAWANLI